jgi:cytochrome bd ubiquinol oxidase subunit I
MGIATGITMEFQFGTNWAYYSHYVGDIFGAPLAIEGLMAFFLESTFVGLFFFGWDRLPKLGHLAVTWLVAIGSNLSALWILIANGWMQHPVGAVFNPATMRMELTSFWDLIFNPVAQAKFVHTVGAGYVTGSMFVAAISSYYLLRGRFAAFAKRSIMVASAFGLASALCVVVLGDESGYTVSENQKMKLAAIEGMWETEPAPAGFDLFGIPDSAQQKVHFAIKMPWVLGIIATRSFDQQIPGINDLVAHAQARIRSGLIAYDALERLKANRDDRQASDQLSQHAADLGYALLLKRYVTDRNFSRNWLLHVTVWSLPLPWIAAELGWIVAEYGRQPWAIDGVLPTFLAASSLSVAQILFSLAGFILFYSSLLVVDLVLMRKYVVMGPVKALGLETAPSEAVPALARQGGRS